MRIDVGIGEYAVTRNPDDSIKTYALGSCVGVILLSSAVGAVGLIHIALPDSKGHDEKAARMPGYFADTGMERLLSEIGKIGRSKGSLVAKMVGGACVLDEGGAFDIGRRNVLAVRKWLWSKGIGLMKEEVGGKTSRTVEVFVDGRVLISSNRKVYEL